MNDPIMKDHERVISFLKTLDRVLGKIEKVIGNYRPTLNGERYLSNKEMAERLKISSRTLQEYRDARMISYHKLGGKILYRESEIQELLECNHTQCHRDKNY